MKRYSVRRIVEKPQLFAYWGILHVFVVCWFFPVPIQSGWFCCYWSLLVVTPIVGVCNCSMFCCALLCFHSSFAIILVRKTELVGLLSLSSWYLGIDVWLFLAVPRVCLQFVIVVFPDYTPETLILWFRFWDFVAYPIISCNYLA